MKKDYEHWDNVWENQLYISDYILRWYGYLREYPVERMLRDSRFPSLGGGTIQIMKNSIAREILKR